MHNSVDIRVRFHYCRVDVALGVAAYCAINWRAICDQVLADVLYSGNNCWTYVRGKYTMLHGKIAVVTQL